MVTNRKTRVQLAGWPLVGWCALVLTTMTVIILGVRGAGELGWRTVIRSTAQTSFMLFTSAFVASALARAWPSPLTRWMLRNRRYLGVSFAVSHGLHLVAIIMLARALGDQFRLDRVTLVGGGLAYGFVAAMAATSFDRTAAWLGPRVWKRLHTTGGYYIWLIFLLQYAVLVTHSLLYAPFAVAALVVMGLRMAARLRVSRLASPTNA